MRLACWILTWTLLGGAAAGDEKASVANDPKLRAQVEALVAQLGSEAFEAREAAEKKLYALGDRLLFEPELGEDADLSVLEQLHNCFILPLHAARQDKNFEIRRRANAIFGEYSFDRPIGRHTSGWALYAACRLRSRIPRPLMSSKDKRAALQPFVGTEKYKQLSAKYDFGRRIHAQLERLAIRNMTLDDPRGTADWVLGDQFKNRSAPLYLVMDVWPHQDFEAALAYFLKVQKQWGYGYETRVSFPLLLEAWPKDRTIAEAAEWVRQFPGQRNDANFPYDVVRRLVKEDLEKALQLAATVQWKEIREGMHSTVIQEVAKTDLKKAEKLIARIDDPDLRKAKSAIIVLELLRRCEPVDESVFESFGEDSADNFRSWRVQYLAEKDPVAASRLVHYPKSKIKRWNLVDDIAEHWMRIDATACLVWAQSLGDEREREKAIMRIAGLLVESDLDAARKLYQSLGDPGYRRRGYERIVTKIAETDPSEALREFEKLIQLKYRHPPTSMLQVWTANDPDGVAKWASNEEDQLTRQMLFRIVADQWAAFDPHAACKWALSIADDEDRFFVLVASANRLLGKFADDK